MSIYPRKKKRLSKKQSQKIHAKKRAVERYGVSFNSKDILQLVKAIQNEKAEFVEKISNRQTKFKVFVPEELKNKCPKHSEVLVIYDKKRKEIVTFLPPSGLNN
ncbi:hypothetical protein GYA37_02600 [candidate division WWE3 bacterium]|uniref:Uncharacterized protein n=1 Tax=candidate division WWE3 bacterium TaxID=2053526 RepID=A0A7X9E735_UNCKA|nr:hypothetical protein [candidate division WWE3 bacterium]